MEETCVKINENEINIKSDDIDKDIKSDNKKFIKLKGKIKKFDEKLYNKYDIPARDIIKNKLGNCVKDNPDIYAEDLILEDESCPYKYIELQVCAKWNSENYPYEYPFVYERKGHFSDDTLFILFNKNMNRGLIFDKKSLNKEPKRIKKYSRTFIYDVPWKNVMSFYVEYFDIELLRTY